MRLFFAIKLPKRVKKEIEKLMNKFPSFKFVNVNNLHITLKFLGEVKNVDEIINSIKFEMKKFNVNLSGVGSFSNNKIIWLGISEGSEELTKLASLIDSNNSNFKPHLTIARCKRECDKSILSESFTSSIFEVSKFFLIKSVLTLKGPVYTVVKDFDLI